jgi:hypothetical protein
MTTTGKLCSDKVHCSITAQIEEHEHVQDIQINAAGATRCAVVHINYAGQMM